MEIAIVNGSTFNILNDLGHDIQVEDIADVKCYIFHYSASLLLQNIIHQQRINSQHYMLPRPVFLDISIHA